MSCRYLQCMCICMCNYTIRGLAQLLVNYLHISWLEQVHLHYILKVHTTIELLPCNGLKFLIVGV